MDRLTKNETINDFVGEIINGVLPTILIGHSEMALRLSFKISELAVEYCNNSKEVFAIELANKLAKYEDIGTVEECERYKTVFDSPCDNCEKNNRLYSKNYQLKQQLENSIQLPCKVGDIVYKICPVSKHIEIGNMWDGEIVKTECQRCAYKACSRDECIRIGFREDSRNIIKEFNFDNAIGYLKIKPYIGTVWFLTRKQAEQRIKELKKEV